LDRTHEGEQTIHGGVVTSQDAPGSDDAKASYSFPELPSQTGVLYQSVDVGAGSIRVSNS
jgi:hypothetical protein